MYLNYSRRKKEIIKGKEKVLVFFPKGNDVYLEHPRKLEKLKDHR